MRILGLDPGLANCGWCLLDSGNAPVLRTGYVGTSKGHETGDMQRRLNDLLDGVDDVVPLAELTVIEWPAGGGAGDAGRTNLTAARQVVAAAGALLGYARAKSRGEVLTPAPITWRSALGCKRGKDAELHERLTRVYPLTIERLRKGARPHVLDAIGLALYGRLHATNQTSTRRSAA